jgi:hypothetical protein
VECYCPGTEREVGEYGEEPVLFVHKESLIRIIESLLGCILPSFEKKRLNGFGISF